MSASRIFDRTRRLNKTQKLSVAGVSALGVAALTFSLVPSNAQAESTNASVAASPVVFASGADSARAKAVQDSVIEQNTTAAKLVKAADAAKAKDEAARKKAVADAKALTDAKAAERAAAEAKVKAADRAKADAAKRSSSGTSETASRSAERKPVYANNLDGWIRESLAIMKAKGIPGTYEGLHRNIIRESSGNPQAINDWDINAQNGVPSIGLLQIIKPTFDYYHVSGTVHSQYDPVANITAAANYAADKYGTIDNVDSAY
ncbi:transglycosylase SLT domain-containing protein [Streptomyces sp. NPDC002690]